MTTEFHLEGVYVRTYDLHEFRLNDDPRPTLLDPVDDELPELVKTIRRLLREGLEIPQVMVSVDRRKRLVVRVPLTNPEDPITHGSAYAAVIDAVVENEVPESNVSRDVISETLYRESGLVRVPMSAFDRFSQMQVKLDWRACDFDGHPDLYKENAPGLEYLPLVALDNGWISPRVNAFYPHLDWGDLVRIQTNAVEDTIRGHTAPIPAVFATVDAVWYEIVYVPELVEAGLLETTCGGRDGPRTIPPRYVPNDVAIMRDALTDLRDEAASLEPESDPSMLAGFTHRVRERANAALEGKVEFVKPLKMLPVDEEVEAE